MYDQRFLIPPRWTLTLPVTKSLRMGWNNLWGGRIPSKEAARTVMALVYLVVEEIFYIRMREDWVSAWWMAKTLSVEQHGRKNQVKSGSKISILVYMFSCYFIPLIHSAHLSKKHQENIAAIYSMLMFVNFAQSYIMFFVTFFFNSMINYVDIE